MAPRSRMDQPLELHTPEGFKAFYLQHAEGLRNFLYYKCGDWQMAEDLIALRDSLGSFKSIQELREVESLPADRIERIALYLEL